MNQPLTPTALNGLLKGQVIHERPGHPLDCRQMMILARAFGDWREPGDGSFAIGHDLRVSSPSLAEAASLGLRSGGHHVTHLGACTTPLLEWTVDHEEFDGGLMISGGCGLPAHNGIYFYGPGAEPLSAADVLAAIRLDSVEALFLDPCVSALHYAHPLPAYAAWLRQSLRGLGRRMKIVVDVGHGAAAAELKEILPHFPDLYVEQIGSDSDPSHSRRAPDPLSAKAQARVIPRIQKTGCGNGAVLDACGTRLVVIDERGRCVNPYVLGVLLAEERLAARQKLRVLYAEPAPAFVDAALSCLGVKSEAVAGSALGQWHAIHDARATLYFDGCGHVSYGDFPGSANALLALFRLMRLLSHGEAPLSARVTAVSKAK
ncbi:hypothetical protein [Acidihalobacter ferrooxydans]|uniref:phosphomannomutase n=1 Tax=Acidihalobacter ferrooxydans TaxID=1765967 RepID=A0A1P8UFX7_9GAMM|nr:hypothetical protein [Acidihalobacter ferrooxydans]APZ42736.1 hypothetical protein BW247_06200 [Acidihalobacter ferrooxydans]